MSPQGSAILRFSMLFLFGALIISLIGSYVVNVFILMGYSTDLLLSSDFIDVFQSISSFFGWLFDTLFLTGVSTYTLATVPDITLSNFSWVYSLIRFIFGLSIVILVASLLFGRI